MCALWGLTVAKFRVVHSLPLGMGSVHKSVDGSLYPVNITLPLKMTSHFSLSNKTLQPGLHRGCIPMRNATVSDGTICLVSTVGQLGILMSHTCVDFTFLLPGKFIVRGDKAICVLSTSVPSIMKMEVAPVFAMAWLVVIVRAFKYCGMGLPNIACAIVTIEVDTVNYFVQFYVTTVMVSSST
jgi:hypothetical protein